MACLWWRHAACCRVAAYTADPRHSTPLYFFYFALFVVVLVLFMANLALPRVYWVFQSFQRAQAYQVPTHTHAIAS